MNVKKLRTVFCTTAALVLATISLSAPPTPEEALEYATSVVLVKRALHDNQIYSYVKEVWRFGSHTETLPPVGLSYGTPMTYDPRMRFVERDAIVFEFGADRPKGLPNSWRIPVTEKGLVPGFQKQSYDRVGLRGAGDVDTIAQEVSEPMNVDEVRKAVNNANRSRKS